MALCLPRKRRAASLATRPSTLSVASITNHSCFTSAGFALNVVMRSLSKWSGGPFSTVGVPLDGNLLGGDTGEIARSAGLRRGATIALRSLGLYEESRT